MNTQEHKYALALRWIAEGKDVQIRWGSKRDWLEMSERNEIVNDEVLRGAGEYEFRLKPRTVKIGSREIEAPVLEPVEGQTLWYWDNIAWAPRKSSGTHEEWARDGHCFASLEACQAAHEAWVALMRGEA